MWNDEIIGAVVTIVVVAVSRLLSRFEHKKTEDKISRIYVLVNGEMKQRLIDAKAEGYKEGVQESQKEK